MITVNVNQAKTHLSLLLAQVEAGEEVTIARNGKPVARLVPCKKRGKRQPGLMKGNKEWEELGKLVLEPLSEEELALWNGGP